MLKKQISFLLCIILCGCVISPHVEKNFDPGCSDFRRKVTLEAEWVVLRGCRDTSACVGELGGGVLLGALSGVVSVAIMIAGNTYYAIDEMGSCKVKLDKKKIKNLKDKN